jgi:serine/threonine protein kinase
MKVDPYYTTTELVALFNASHPQGEGDSKTADYASISPGCITWLTTLPQLPSWEELGSPAQSVLSRQGIVIKLLRPPFINEVMTMYQLQQPPRMRAVVHLGSIHVAADYVLLGLPAFPFTLATILATPLWRQQLDPWQVTDELLTVVAELHHRNIVHGDLKPENIVVDEDGRVALIDWGLSYLTGTEVDHQLCTPHYRPPELWNPESDYVVRVHPMVDVWALGAIVFQLFTGHLYCYMHELSRRHCSLRREEQRVIIVKAHSEMMMRVREVAQSPRERMHLFDYDNNRGVAGFASPQALECLPIGARLLLTGMLTPLYRRWTSIDLAQLWNNLQFSHTRRTHFPSSVSFQIMQLVHPDWVPMVHNNTNQTLMSFAPLTTHGDIPSVIQATWVLNWKCSVVYEPHFTAIRHSTWVNVAMVEV